VKPIRVIRNHYLCDECPNEWTYDMLVISHDWCPCCDGKCEPYASESLIEADVTEEME
jgi:hypothetical protein